jgi:putative flippase GtrA
MESGIDGVDMRSQRTDSLKRSLFREIWGLFKYGLVGGSSLALHVGLYHLFSRILWPSGYRTVEYVIALTIASIYNFLLHRTWTFGVKGSAVQMIGRYIGVILTSMAIQSIVFHIGVDLMHVYDYYVFVVSAALAALFQYFGHRFFTFHRRFEKIEIGY